MAVIVDPARLDPHRRGHKRREERGFEIEAVEHRSNVADSTRRAQGRRAAPSEIALASVKFSLMERPPFCLKGESVRRTSGGFGHLILPLRHRLACNK